MILKHVVAQALICPSFYLGILRVQSQTSGISLFATSFINFTVPNQLLCLSLHSQLQLIPSKLWDAATLQSDSYTYTFRKNFAGSIVSVTLSWQSMKHTFVKWRRVSTKTVRRPIPEDSNTVMATEMRVCNVIQFIHDSWLSILPNTISEVIHSSHKAELCTDYFQGLLVTGKRGGGFLLTYVFHSIS